MSKFYILNLQLLAEGDGPEVNTTLSPGLSAENKTFYDKQLIRRAKAKLVHDQFGQKRNIPKGSGKTVEFRQFASLPKATTP